MIIKKILKLIIAFSCIVTTMSFIGVRAEQEETYEKVLPYGLPIDTTVNPLGIDDEALIEASLTRNDQLFEYSYGSNGFKFQVDGLAIRISGILPKQMGDAKKDGYIFTRPDNTEITRITVPYDTYVNQTIPLPNVNGLYTIYIRQYITDTSYYNHEVPIKFTIVDGVVRFEPNRFDVSSRYVFRKVNYADLPSNSSVLNENGYAAINAKATELCATATTPSEKAKIIYQWVADNIYYDYEALRTNVLIPAADPVTVFNTKRAVCSGYARLLRVMFRAVGIPVVNIYGFAGSGDGAVNHEWNAIYLNGSWHYIDVTWDSNNRYNYNESSGFEKRNSSLRYYLITPERIASDHRSDEVYGNVFSTIYEVWFEALKNNSYDIVDRNYYNSQNESIVSIYPSNYTAPADKIVTGWQLNRTQYNNEIYPKKVSIYRATYRDKKYITSLSAEVASHNVLKGSTVQIVTSVLPSDHDEGSLKFKSSNTSILEVDNNGNVLAKENGTVTVTVSSEKLSEVITFTVSGVPDKPVPTDVVVVQRNNGQLELSSNNSEWLSAIHTIELFDGNSKMNCSTEFVSKKGNKVIISPKVFNNSTLVNKQVKVLVQSTGFTQNLNGYAVACWTVNKVAASVSTYPQKRFYQVGDLVNLTGLSIVVADNKNNSKVISYETDSDLLTISNSGSLSKDEEVTCTLGTNEILSLRCNVDNYSVEKQYDISYIENSSKTRTLVVNQDRIVLKGKNISLADIERLTLVTSLENKSTDPKVILLEISSGSSLAVNELVIDVTIKGGMVLRCSIPLIRESNSVMIGDVDGDKSLNVNDIVRVSYVILGQLSPSPYLNLIADVNGDGKITVTDITMISNAILNNLSNPY